MSDEPIRAGLAAAEAATALPEEVYSTRDAMDILVDNRQDPEEVWGGLQLVPGQIMEVIGGSGLGKSRMMLNLAVNQVLGRPFAGLPTLQRPLTWLFYGNENSFYRFRYDLRKMVSVLTTQEREKLRGRIWLPTMETAGDAFVSFTDERNREKLKATMRQRKPDVLVLDPWGSFIDGDELSDGDVRRTITEIIDILAANDSETPTVAIVLNHSRNGLSEIVKAAGPERANYGKNSKAIFSVVRCVWNLRPAELAEPPNKIELIHAKSSDRAPYLPRAVSLNKDTFHYQEDTTFNHAVWQAALEKAYRSGSALTVDQRGEARQRTFEEDCKKMLNYIDAQEMPISKTKDLDKWAKENLNGNSEYCQTIYQQLVRKGNVVSVGERRPGGRKLVWTKEKMVDFLKKKPPENYKLEDGVPSLTPPCQEGSVEVGKVAFGEFSLEDSAPDSAQ